MTSALEQSFKKRLQLIAKERNQTPVDVWQNVIAERFLVRLCDSPHRSHFILKGGWLLAKHVELGRETKDLDFTIERLSNKIDVLQKVLNEIITVELHDGFSFTNLIVTPLEHFHMQYPGAQVKISVQFGKAKFPLFIDLGFGDLVKIQEQNVLLIGNSNGPLFEPSVTLRCYPIEFVFAEKLETVVFRGAENSRMKDFHDLHTLVCTKETLSRKMTMNAIHAVFEHRKTPLRLPIGFDITGLEALQNYWDRYRQTATAGNALPNRIEQIIEVINKWIEND